MNPSSCLLSVHTYRWHNAQIAIASRYGTLLKPVSRAPSFLLGDNVRELDDTSQLGPCTRPSAFSCRHTYIATGQLRDSPSTRLRDPPPGAVRSTHRPWQRSTDTSFSTPVCRSWRGRSARNLVHTAEKSVGPLVRRGKSLLYNCGSPPTSSYIPHPSKPRLTGRWRTCTPTPTRSPSPDNLRIAPR